MLRDMTYQQKFQILEQWMPLILESIKRDLKQEHLLTDRNFVKIYFPGKQVQRLTIEDLAPAYSTAIAKEEGEKLGEFVAVRWILKRSDMYHYFEKQLKEFDPKFDELEELDEKFAEALLNSSVEQFGAINTYLFSVINSVVFPKNLLNGLKEKAEQENAKKRQENAPSQENAASEELKKKHEAELKKIVDKYEKKLSGMQSKYLTDTENFKKQISQLQSKLHKHVS